MKLIEVFRQKKAVFSFEVFPPKKDADVAVIYSTLEQLRDLSPDFISVTYGAGGNLADNSTCEICSIIKKSGVEPLAHLTCLNSTREEVLTVLGRLQEAGIENVLALRGDRNPKVEPKEEFHYARELIQVIRENSGMDIAAACYPECHPACDSMEEDIRHLKEKVDAGATHLISQLFFDNEDFYRFLEKARAAGVRVPIEAGIMPVTNRRQIERMVSLCGASMPKKLVRILSRYENDDTALRDAGIAYATDQIVDLLSNGVEGIHLYTMNNPLVAHRISDNIASILRSLNQ